MSWDTLQRWHEQGHVDTAPFRITPFVPPVIPRYSPWEAISRSLQTILPNLDPVAMAQRRLAMAQIPLEQQKLQAQKEMLPLQIAAQKRLLQAAGSPQQGWYIGPDGKWHQKSDKDQARETAAEVAQHNNAVTNDSINYHFKTNVPGVTTGPAGPGVNQPPPLLARPPESIPSVEVGQPETDNTQQQSTDVNGNPIYDTQGNPVYVTPDNSTASADLPYSTAQS